MDEEAVLKKKLETCEDFTERREIRRRLKEIRQQKSEAPEPVSQSGRSHRKEEYTEETTTTTSDGITVTEKHTTKTEVVENGDVVKKEETLQVSSKMEDVDGANQEEPGAEDEAEPDEAERPENESPPQDEAENVPLYLQKNPEELTEQEIGEIDDLDFLESTLNKLPIKFFDVRKHLRARIRNVKVNQGAKAAQSNMFGNQNSHDVAERKREDPLRITKQRKQNDCRSRIETNHSDGDFLDHKSNSENSNYHFENTHENDPVTAGESFSIEQIASDTLLHRLNEPGLTNELHRDDEVHSEDEEGSPLSSPSVSSSTSDMENSASSCNSSLAQDENTNQKQRSVTAHILEPLQPGRKKTDFQSKLKKTGLSPKLDISTSGKIGSLGKKDQTEKIDLRKNLKSVPGTTSFTRWGSWSEKYGPSLRSKPSKQATEEPPKGRRISSSDLFNILNQNKPKPVEDNSRKVSLPYTLDPPKIIEPKDDKFENVMAERKKSSSRQYAPSDSLIKTSPRESPAWSPKQLRKATYVPPLPGPARKLSAGSLGRFKPDTSEVDLQDADIDKMLKEVDVKELDSLKIEEPKTRAKRKTSSGNIRWVQEPQINIKDKGQLSALRQQIEHEKSEKQGGGLKTTTTKTIETRTDGTGTSITKTTTTSTTRGALGGQGGIRNFEAEMAKRKKERSTAKAAQFKSAKAKRNAFKDQLEAANPKPAGGTKKSFNNPNTAVNALLEWCRRKTRGYQNVDIQNYTTSWADGLAMCAIFHNFSPDLIPWETLDPKDRKRNWTLAFDAAYAEGMDPLLELEDVLCVPVPEPRSLITYVHSIYQHFHEKAEKAKAEQGTA